MADCRSFDPTTRSSIPMKMSSILIVGRSILVYTKLSSLILGYGGEVVNSLIRMGSGASSFIWIWWFSGANLAGCLDGPTEELVVQLARGRRRRKRPNLACVGETILARPRKQGFPCHGWRACLPKQDFSLPNG